MTKTYGISGTGLIGTSLALGLLEAGCEVLGWDPDPAALAVASERGITPVASFEALCASDCDVLVLAGPPAAIVATVADDVTFPGLVVDVASVKAPVVAANLFPRFVGSHPMAGRETRGPKAASSTLFRGAAWVVASDGASDEDLALAGAMIKIVGARPLIMTAAAHDAAVAAISHLPQLLASSLMHEVSDRPEALALAAGSFRDLTRVAASDSDMWMQILDANRPEVIGVLTAYIERLQQLASDLATNDDGSLESLLVEARAARRELTAHIAAVRVILADQPGEMARVGRAFEQSGVDVRDLQLRHAPYGGGGVLTVSVTVDDRPHLEAALVEQGLLVDD